MSRDQAPDIYICFYKILRIFVIKQQIQVEFSEVDEEEEHGYENMGPNIDGTANSENNRTEVSGGSAEDVVKTTINGGKSTQRCRCRSTSISSQGSVSSGSCSGSSSEEDDVSPRENIQKNSKGFSDFCVRRIAQVILR